jgi:hypothetical protein
VGLAEFDRTGDEILLHVSVERMARWLLDSSVDRDEFMLYHLDFPWPLYFLKPPWRSCLAEAFGGMFLVAFGSASKDRSYVDCGVKHLKSLLVPISKGGLRSDDSKFFLEYVGYERRNRWPIVLNGHLYCLVTLFNAWRMLGIEDFKVAFDQAVSELDSLLPVFEGRFLTYYDDYGNPATLFYHRIHIHLLETIYELTMISRFQARAERWKEMLPRYNFTLSLMKQACSMRIPYLPRR